MSVLSACLIGLTIVTQVPAKNWEKVKVVSVIATDTVVVEAADNPMLWVNLLGVGTPESVDSRKETFLLGKPNLNWLENWIPSGTPVWMERRGTTVTGRPIVMLYRTEDNFCWNAFLVKSGCAYARAQLKFSEFSKLASYEAQAKDKKVGLWEGYESPTPVAPPAEVKPRRIQTVFTPPNFVAPPRKPRRRYASQATTAGELDMMMGSMMMGSMMMNPGYGSGYGYYGGMNGPGNGYSVHVRDYWRSDGTFVQSHYRRPPGTAY